MSDDALSPVRQALLDFSRGRVGNWHVTRALLDHNDWLVPALALSKFYGRSEAPALYVLGEQTVLPPGKFLLFTDFPAATAAQHAGVPMGPLCGGVGGLELFSKVCRDWEEVSVNAGSPAEQTWYYAPDSYEALEQVARQIAFERHLGAFVLKGDNLLSAITADGFGLMLFTAPDCVEAARRALAADGTLDGAEFVMIKGTIVDKIPSEGVIGVVVNAFGPGPRADVWWQ